MTHESRPEVVDRLVREFAHVLDDDDATAGERNAAARAFVMATTLANITPPIVVRAAPTAPSLVEYSYRDVVLECTAELEVLAAKRHLLDRLGPFWASRPDLPLSDVLKVMTPALIHDVAERLRAVGVRDLDEVDAP